MFYEILHPKVKLNAQKRLRCKARLLGKHFVLVSQNLESKIPELLSFFSYWKEKAACRKECRLSKIFQFIFFLITKLTLGTQRKKKINFYFKPRNESADLNLH